jgi:glycosyltransferase involved in cell wall biosynthesis
VDVVALSAGTDGERLPITVLGRRRLGPRTLWQLRRRSRHADVVVAYGSSTLPACIMALIGGRTAFVYRSISDPGRWLRGPVHRLVTRFQYRRPEAIAALWDGAAASITELFGVPASRLAVIPNARDPAQFRPPSAEERARARDVLGLAASDVVVAFVGSLSDEKRPDVAIEAMRERPDHVLLVAGAGPLRADAEALAERVAPGRVRFLGEVGDVIPVLHAADVVLITSAVEGMPGVAIEALMSGVPVLATGVGALSTMRGVEVVDPTAEAFSRALGGVRPTLSLDVAAEWGWPAVTDRWLDLLEGPLVSPRPPQAARTLAANASHTRPT